MNCLSLQIGQIIQSRNNVCKLDTWTHDYGHKTFYDIGHDIYMLIRVDIYLGIFKWDQVVKVCNMSETFFNEVIKKLFNCRILTSI